MKGTTSGSSSQKAIPASPRPAVSKVNTPKKAKKPIPKKKTIPKKKAVQKVCV